MQTEKTILCNNVLSSQQFQFVVYHINIQFIRQFPSFSESSHINHLWINIRHTIKLKYVIYGIDSFQIQSLKHIHIRIHPHHKGTPVIDTGSHRCLR